jgi:LysR family transcriptional regulator, carnitine catabolism transcriptional activator
MDLRRLEMFVAVVDEGGVTRAARATHVSQPALSQAIRALEAELGTALFDRIGRGVRLTAAGEALLEPARQALRDVQTAEAAVMAVRGLGAGRLALGSLRTLAADPTAPLVGAFRAVHPAVRVQLADPDDPEDLLAMVRSGDVELAITEAPRDARGLAVHALADQELVAVLPPGTRVAEDVTPLRQLAEHPFITTPPGTSSRRVLQEAFARAGHEPRIAVETGQREAILPLVLAGAGVALVPATVAETAARLGAVVVACRPPIRRSIVLLHRDGPLSPAADRFRALVVDPS